MTSNPIQYSFVGSALEKASFRIEETDGRVAAIGKFTAGKTANAVLALAAFVETVVFATLTAVSSPLYFIAPERFSALTQHTSASAYAGTKALKEIIGIIDEAIKKEEKKIEPTKWEVVCQVVREKTAILMEHRGKIPAACFTTALLVLLYNYRTGILETIVGKTLPQCTLEEAPRLALPRPEDTYLAFAYKLARYTEDVTNKHAFDLASRAHQLPTSDSSDFVKNALYYGGIAFKGLKIVGKRTGQVAFVATAAIGIAGASVFGASSVLLE